MNISPQKTYRINVSYSLSDAGLKQQEEKDLMKALKPLGAVPGGSGAGFGERDLNFSVTGTSAVAKMAVQTVKKYLKKSTTQINEESYQQEYKNPFASPQKSLQWFSLMIKLAGRHPESLYKLDAFNQNAVAQHPNQTTAEKFKTDFSKAMEKIFGKTVAIKAIKAIAEDTLQEAAPSEKNKTSASQKTQKQKWANDLTL